MRLPKKELHAQTCNTCLWLGWDLCAVSLAVLTALTYGMLWMNRSAPEDLGGRGEEQHGCWFWLKHVVFLCLLWAVCRTNYSLLSLLSYVFAPKGSVLPAPQWAIYLPTWLLKPCVCVCTGCNSWKGAPHFSCTVHYRALSVFSCLNEFVMDYQTGFLKKEKMSMPIFQWSNIATFTYDFLISSAKVFRFLCRISYLI